MKPLYIGVDLGGTKIASVITDNEGNILNSDLRETQAAEGTDKILQRIYDSIGTVAKDNLESVKGIGVISPGPVNIRKGVIINAPNLQWNNIPIVKLIKDKFPLPCILENDANGAAYAEKKFGVGKQFNDLIYITVSTGIGGGIIVGGEIVHGRDDSAGEIGHLSVVDWGPLCGCGHRGCLETVSSGTAIARQAKNLIQDGVPSLILDLVNGELNQITSKTVAEAAEKGDLLARRILFRAFDYLGIAVANLVQIFNPEMIIIGGGVSKIGKPLFDQVWQVVREHTYPHTIQGLQIVPSSIGDNLGALGAAAVAIKNYG
jgi:glucokinase